MSDLVAIGYAVIGAFLPLLGSGLIPNGIQRWAAALFAVIGLFVFFNHMTNDDPSSFSVGLGIGFLLATIKLATGLRFL
jgi:hypothetical protein